MRQAIYALSGDPIHYGHIDVIERTARTFDRVVVGFGVNAEKRYLFSLEERLAMARRVLGHIPNVEVTSFPGLLVDYAAENGIETVVKGIRDAADADYELRLHHAGESQGVGVDTFLLPAKENMKKFSSSTVKALQKEHGDVQEYVPLHVKQKLEEKMSGQYIVGITGEIGSGKSHVGRSLERLAREKGYEAHNIELDKIGHDILGRLPEKLYANTRQEIGKVFGDSVLLQDGVVDRKALGEIVFNEPAQLDKLNEIMRKPLLVRLRKELYDKKGFVFINAALLAEAGLAYVCNNNVVLVNANHASQNRRMHARGLSVEQITRRKESQYNFEQKKKAIVDKIEKDRQGNLWVIENSDGQDNTAQLFSTLTNYFGLPENAHVGT